jgi:hypothetical protein
MKVQEIHSGDPQSEAQAAMDDGSGQVEEQLPQPVSVVSFMDTVHSEPASQFKGEPRLRDLPFRLNNIPRWLLLAVIRFYQATLSHALPADTCRFYPTCSHYGYQAIYKYGALKGGWMAVWRILRCNPFNPGGFDPVP